VKQPIRKLNTRRATVPAKTVRHVVAAMILREQSAAKEIFICQRRADQPMGLKWEFPGGKIELGETAQQALARELSEELGIAAQIGDHVTTVHHSYRNGSAIEIQFFRVTRFDGELENRIFEDMRWSSLQALPEYDFLAADHTLIRDLADGRLL
jgi:8-oxo-dGTP diphosphatase